LEFRLSALMGSDLAWVNDKSADKADAMLIADAFQRSIISGAIYHLTILLSYVPMNARIHVRNGLGSCVLNYSRNLLWLYVS